MSFIGGCEPVRGLRRAALHDGVERSLCFLLTGFALGKFSSSDVSDDRSVSILVCLSISAHYFRSSLSFLFIIFWGGALVFSHIFWGSVSRFCIHH